MSRYHGFRTRGWTVNFATFGMRDLSRVLDVSPACLLAWRSQRWLVGNWDGDGRFDSRDVMEIAVIHRLGDLLGSKSEEMSVVCQATQHIMWHAIVYENGSCEAWGTSPDVSACLKQIKTDETAADDLTGLQTAKRYLAWPLIEQADDRRPTFRSQLIDAPTNLDVILDLQAMATQIRRRLRRPLLDIEVSFRSHGPRAKRRSIASRRQAAVGKAR